jgi:hypothetical protein
VLSEALVAVPSLSSPAVPWRDPHTIPQGELTSYIRALELACLDHPASADLRTVLGMAHAVNHDVYKSMDALEAATSIDPSNFWAQLKYAELHYRLRALTRAEELTVTALNLATNGWQLSLARKQLQEIRRLSRDSTRNVTWNKPLTGPVVVLSVMMLVVAVIMMLK